MVVIAIVRNGDPPSCPISAVCVYEHCDAMKWRCYQLQTTALSSADSPLDLGQFYADDRYAEAEC